MSDKKLTIGICQHSPRLFKPKENGRFLLDSVEDVARRGARLIVLPELSTTGPLDKEHLYVAESTTEFVFNLKTLCDRLNVYVVAGLPEPSNGACYNSAFVIGPDMAIESYRKVHLFPLFGEDKCFLPGQGPLNVWIDFGFGELGIAPLICFDIRFPELAREVVLNGAYLVVVPALWPKERVEQFLALLKARAIENQCFFLGVNATGTIGGTEFAGNSICFDPLGRSVFKASGGVEKGVFQVDFAMVEEVRKRFLTAVPRRWGRHSSSKVMGLAELKRAVRRRQRAGQKCVFTNGCFDILHAGHVSYLEEARRKGDFLVVGVNTDASVRRIKGSARPVNPEGMRAKTVAALDPVDYVVLFNDPTPIKVIEAIVPNCLVKGEDWPEDQIVGAAFVKEKGGRVERIPFVHDISTSKIIGRIIKGRPMSYG